jgi:hypothetical protein
MELPRWDSRALTPPQENSVESSTARKLTLDNYTDILCYLEDFRVLVCKQHCTAVVNLNAHIRDQHATPAALRKEIVERLRDFPTADPGEVELPEQPAWPIQELGTPLNGFKCKTCGFTTVNNDAVRKHCKKSHQQAWTGDKRQMFDCVKVQTLFRTGGLQKYFVVNLESTEIGEEGAVVEHTVQGQLAEYRATQESVEQELQVLGEAAKTDKTGWFKRTGWLEHFKNRNLVHVAHQARLPGHDERKLKLAAELTERLLERSVKGLSTLALETRRWLRSAQPTKIDPRPLARLQNPESQSVYASYVVKFVCYYLRIIADEGARIAQSQDETASSESDGESS